MVFDPSKFVAPTAKPIPVVLLLDVSGSMSGSRIDQLNLAVREMISSFSSSETSEIEIQLAVITFGADVKLHTAYTSATDIEWQDLSVSGLTPMGAALKMAKAMIEDKEVTPSRAYRPTIVLVSDGGPNDDWEGPLNDFIQNGRSSKCDRMAVAIGDGADRSVLNRFIEGCEYPLFTPDNASDIRNSFRYITMSVTARSKSQNPNKVVNVSAQSEQKTPEYEDDELF
ncbi:VWA domain-containing protein [Vibrio parahaemolyticus]|uniref:vWA domain-containing protein n=1 Tax=Vibrio parahaemolyticus TaxID=670 RepID=UPI00084A661C|nr:VWA domain-containing protein [Vibrio parahaemolyticus]EGQ9693534.1 VWA domain-containing protein [Vibrio parahaemolyticus]EGR1958876.1 VWA domain-containing protein [Vibrio parahaemolyticus]EGR1968057.1 VWA domain-containing protein [Vibrio parahaemolyticus]EHR6711694.1 VWA domain-containing protein [Vibrio parahaemolyticus]ELA9299488.1 VWA domain-containing protein [Vibrio parahaemolyticus]